MFREDLVTLPSVDQINLESEKFNNAEALKKLNVLMFDLQQNVNDKYGEELLNDDGRINMNRFLQKNNGPYTSQVKEHKKTITARENSFYKTYQTNVQQYYIDRYHITGASLEEITEKIKNIRKDLHEHAKASMVEKAVPVIMHKILNNDKKTNKYLVARTSLYDDYEHGVDNLIINTQTGEVICAIDELFHPSTDRDDTRLLKKQQKINEEGGSQISYGLTFDNGQLVKTELTDCPTFYLSLDSEDLDVLFKDLELDINAKPNQQELLLFDKMIDSIDEQIEMQKMLGRPSMIEKIDKLKDSLLTMREIRQNLS